MARRADVRTSRPGLRIDDLRRRGLHPRPHGPVTGRLAEETTLLPVAHLTAVGHSIDELRAMVGAYADRGITNILALRGDPPGNPLGEWEKHPEGLEYADELVRLVRDLGDFHVGVASFPEGHHRSPDLDHDTRYLVQKLRAGAEYSITQMFFDVEHYLRLRDRVVACDAEQGLKPIIPRSCPSRRCGRRDAASNCRVRICPPFSRSGCGARRATARRRTARPCARWASRWPRRCASG